MASRRLATTASRLPSVAASNTAQFPPKQSLYERSDIPKVAFDPEAWAAAQPPPPSALIAFAHRIGLSTIMSTPETVEMTCTHPSFLHLHRRVFPDAPRPETNGQLSELGNALMGMLTSEFVHAAYPYLPTRVWRAATSAYVGSGSCANVAREMGATPLLRWHRTVCPIFAGFCNNIFSPQLGSGSVPAVMHDDALASIPRAITGLIYQQRSLPSARQFVHSYFLSRQIDLQGMLKFVDPKNSLLEVVRKFGRERPVSRYVSQLLALQHSPSHLPDCSKRQAGFPILRYTLSASFLVQTSLARAMVAPSKWPSTASVCLPRLTSLFLTLQIQAAEDALHRVYLTRTPDDQIQLPSSTFPLGLGDVFRSGPEGAYTAPEVVVAEVSHGSASRSGVKLR